MRNQAKPQPAWSVDYHLPGFPYYEATRAEVIFCAEAQAQAAGYRRAIVR